MFDQEAPSGGQRWDVFRFPAGNSKRLMLLSAEWVRLTTHFVGHTVLCPTSSDCPLCDQRPGRPYWYLPAKESRFGTIGLLELSASSSSDLEQKARYAAGGFSSGTIFTALRKTARRPLSIDVESVDASVPSLELHVWFTALMCIYRCPPMVAGESLTAYGQRVRKVVWMRADIAAGRLEAGQLAGAKGRR